MQDVGTLYKNKLRKQKNKNECVLYISIGMCAGKKYIIALQPFQ